MDSTGADSTGALDSIAGLGNSFKAKKAAGLANEASFQAKVMRELARLANAPASAYEVICYTFLAEHCSHMSTLIRFQAEVMRELACPANAPT